MGKQLDEQLAKLAEEKMNPKLFAQESDEGEESEEKSRRKARRDFHSFSSVSRRRPSAACPALR